MAKEVQEEGIEVAYSNTFPDLIWCLALQVGLEHESHHLGAVRSGGTDEEGGSPGSEVHPAGAQWAAGDGPSTRKQSVRFLPWF